MAEHLIVAIDGPAGAGKTTLGRMLARELGLLYIDTGSMYRAVALAVIESGTNESDDVTVGVLAERIDIDLAGLSNNAARSRHIENPGNAVGSATDNTIPIGVAQGFTWSARTHDAIDITNPSFHNAHNDTSAYRLMPLVTGGGLTQHYEAFTRNEFWVTPYNAAQFAAKDLPTYVTGQPSVTYRDIVVWYKGSLHHHPRAEDGVTVLSYPYWIGTTHAMWTGFMLMPRDLFDCSPFYQPCP